MTTFTPGGLGVNQPWEYHQLDRIAVPACRQVCVRNRDGFPVPDSVSFAIDIPDVTID